MGLSSVVYVLIYGVSIAVFYKRGYRTGIVHGLNKILDEMDE